jgi:type I restriction enzyme S subunit
MSKMKPEIRFGEFADAWEKRKLEDLADVRDGTHNSPQYYSEGHPLITSKNVKNGFINYDDIQYISDGDFEEINRRSKVDKNDILMGMIGTIGNIALVRETPDFAIKNVALIKDTKSIYYLYLYHYLQSSNILNQLVEGMDGGTQKFIALNKIRNLIIAVPRIEEQYKISNYMEHLDNLITLHQRKLDKMKNLKSAYLSKMFPKEGEKYPRLRFAGFTDAWEQRKLGELTNIKTGSSDLQDAVDNGEYPFFVRSENVERSNRYIFDGEAILIPGEGRLGDIYHYINGKFDYHQRVYKISDFADSNTDGKFVLYYLQQNFKRHALKFTVKATVDSLRLPMLVDFEIKLPNIDEQREVGVFFSNLDNLITLHQRELEKLKQLKQAMLQKMFV